MNDTELAYSKLVKASYLFNELSGADKEVSKTAFDSQYSLIKEEFKEIQESMYNNSKIDVTELLDGCIDVLVVTYGMLQKLEKLGCNVNGAIVATADNNLTKFIPITEAHLVQPTVEMYMSKGVNVYTTFNKEHNVFIIRDFQGKVRKPIEYISNDLSELTKGVTIED